MKLLRYIVLPVTLSMVAASGLAATARASSLDSEANVKLCVEKFTPPDMQSRDSDWYNPDVRCAANKKMRHQRKRCEDIVDSLLDISGKLRGLVEQGCRENVPQLLSVGCAFDSTQPNCMRKSAELLNNADYYTKKVGQALTEYVGKTRELKKSGFKGATEVKDSIAWGEKQQAAMDKYDAQLAVDTGCDTIGVYLREANAGQTSQDLDSVMKGVSKDDSDISGHGTPLATGAALAASWNKLNDVKSPIAHEHLVNYLDAKDVLTRIDKYKNQMASVQSAAKKYMNHNTASAEGLGSIETPEASQGLGSVPDGGTGKTPSGGGGAGGGMAGSQAFRTDANAERGSAKKNPAGVDSNSTNAKKTEVASPADSAAFHGKLHTALKSDNGMSIRPQLTEAAEGSTSATGGSRSKGSALRDAIRQKLLGSGGGSASSPGTNLASASESDKRYSRGGSFQGASNGRSLASVASEGEAVDNFEGSLNRGGVQVGGTEGESSVRSLLDELQPADGSYSDYVQAAAWDASMGGVDSASLFERVRILHHRCLRHGCVKN
jgi:hypothetical protein